MRLSLFLETIDPLFWFWGWRGECRGAYLPEPESQTHYLPPEWICSQITHIHTRRVEQCAGGEVFRALFIEHFHLKTEFTKCCQNMRKLEKMKKLEIRRDLKITPAMKTCSNNIKFESMLMFSC